MSVAQVDKRYRAQKRPWRRSMDRRHEAGFTLLELLVVLAILGLIAAVAAPQLIGYLGRAKSETAELQVDRLSGILDLYRLDVGTYPPVEAGLGALLAAPPGVTGWNGPYVTKAEAIVDPWGRPFGYRFPGQHGAFDLYTLGADGQQGGDGEARDIGNW